MAETFIKIETSKDFRWYPPDGVKRSIDVGTSELYKKTGRDYFDDSLFAEDQNGMMYWRNTDNTSVVCFAKINERKRYAILAIYSEKEIDDCVHSVSKFSVPIWFENLDEDNIGPNCNNLAYPEKWFALDIKDSWEETSFSRATLAYIIDRLLQSKRIVLHCGKNNFQAGKQLLYCVLRSLPKKISNKFSFSTASKDAEKFDICCGNFSIEKVREIGGERIDVEKELLLADKSTYGEATLTNPYAYYISTTKGDPCVGFEEIDNIDELNSKVKQKVLDIMCKNIIEKCINNDVKTEDLEHLVDSVQGNHEQYIKQLQSIACYLCLNYIGFSRYYLNIAEKYQEFYLSFIPRKEICTNWYRGENIDALFSINENDVNWKFIKMLFDIWEGNYKSVYKNNNEIATFLFSDYDGRFKKENEGLQEAFEQFWGTLNDNDFLSFILHDKILESDYIADYIARRFEFKQADNIKALRWFCNRLLSAKGVGESIFSKIYAIYIDKLISIGDTISSDILVRIKNDMIDLCIASDCNDCIYKLDERINRANQEGYETAIQCIDNSVRHEFKISSRGETLVKKWNKREKGKGEPERLIDAKDTITVYNFERMDERDYGKSGTIHNANWSVRLRNISTFLFVLFVMEAAAFCISDLLLLHSLYIVGFWRWIEIALSGLAFIGGAIIWIWIIVGIKALPDGECDKNHFESKMASLLMWLFVISFIAIILKGVIVTVATLLI